LVGALLVEEGDPTSNHPQVVILAFEAMRTDAVDSISRTL
jgi:hypothetical protein